MQRERDCLVGKDCNSIGALGAGIRVSTHADCCGGCQENDEGQDRIQQLRQDPFSTQLKG
jgi:hypothetical protein